jgi:hypothetical protein
MKQKLKNLETPTTIWNKGLLSYQNIKPGPEVGKAYQFLLDLRLDKGILGVDKATEELKTWWAKNS